MLLGSIGIFEVAQVFADRHLIEDCPWEAGDLSWSCRDDWDPSQGYCSECITQQDLDDLDDALDDAGDALSDAEALRSDIMSLKSEIENSIGYAWLDITWDDVTHIYSGLCHLGESVANGAATVLAIKVAIGAAPVSGGVVSVGALVAATATLKTTVSSANKAVKEFRTALNNIKDRKTIVQCEQCYRSVTREELNDPNGPHEAITCQVQRLDRKTNGLVPCGVPYRKCRGGCPDPNRHYHPPSQSQDE